MENCLLVINGSSLFTRRRVLAFCVALLLVAAVSGLGVYWSIRGRHAHRDAPITTGGTDKSGSSETVGGLSDTTGSPRSGRNGTVTSGSNAEKDRLSASSERPFDTSVNAAICGRREEVVQLQGDDVKDYSPEINSALEMIRLAGGGSVRLRKGIYWIGRQIYIGDNTCLVGMGMNETVIKVMPRSQPFQVAGVVRVRRAERVSVISLTIDGNRKDQNDRTGKEAYGRYGFYSTETRFVWLKNVKIVNNREYGFDPHGIPGKWSERLVIENCFAENNGLDGFTIDQTLHVALLDSVAVRNGRHGVNIVSGSKDVLVKRVKSLENGSRTGKGCGFMIQNNKPALKTMYVRLRDNIVQEARRGGVCLSDVKNVTMSNLKVVIQNNHYAPCILLHETRESKGENVACNVKSGLRIKAFPGAKFEDQRGQ